MWALQNETPYAAERTWIRDKEGTHRWVVCVKATYRIDAAGGVRLADEQPPPLHLPEYNGEPGASSLKYDADLGPEKPTTDILLNGQAHAPRGKPARTVEVALRVGSLRKHLLVHGMRVYVRALTGVKLSAPVEFTRRQLVYEWAYGGSDTSAPDPRRHVMDTRNPVGKGVAFREQDLVDRPGYSIEYPRGDASKLGPAGFAAIASHWSPRLELAGTYNPRWEETRKPLLPLDYDERHVLSAPSDQRPPQHLHGGERVELLNLSPTGQLHFELPEVRLGFTTSFGRRRHEHEAKLATLIIEPDEGRLMLVWRTSLAVRTHDVDHLDVTTIQERRGTA